MKREIIVVKRDQVVARRLARNEKVIKVESFVTEVNKASSLKKEFYRKGCITL